MLTLLDKLRVIEATGVLGVDLSWLNGNYQRALVKFQQRCVKSHTVFYKSR
jgi:hypothetical protein